MSKSGNKRQRNACSNYAPLERTVLRTRSVTNKQKNKHHISAPTAGGATLYQKMEIFDILGAALPLAVAIEVKFCTAKRTNVPVGPAKFDVNRCNELPLRGMVWYIEFNVPLVTV